jgi:hypothetical protein
MTMLCFHFHAKYRKSRYEVLIVIETLEIYAGSLPKNNSIVFRMGSK